MSKEYKTKQPTQLPNLIVTPFALSKIKDSFDRARKASMEQLEKGKNLSRIDFVEVK
jgi:hypothetical protein